MRMDIFLNFALLVHGNHCGRFLVKIIDLFDRKIVVYADIDNCCGGTQVAYAGFFKDFKNQLQFHLLFCTVVK